MSLGSYNKGMYSSLKNQHLSHLILNIVRHRWLCSQEIRKIPESPGNDVRRWIYVFTNSREIPPVTAGQVTCALPLPICSVSLCYTHAYFRKPLGSQIAEAWAGQIYVRKNNDRQTDWWTERLIPKALDEIYDICLTQGEGVEMSFWGEMLMYLEETVAGYRVTLRSFQLEV